MLLDYSLSAICRATTDFRQFKILVAKPSKILPRDLRRLLDYFLIKQKFGAIAFHDQVALTLYTQGVETGVVVDMGETSATIVPVYAGHAIQNLDRRMNIGGRSLSRYMDKLLMMRGHRLDPSRSLEVARKVKEELTYVAMDPDQESKLNDETTVLDKTVQLGNTSNSISLGRERHAVVEPFFHPDIIDLDEPGIADVVFDLIQRAAIDCRADLYSNIILSGGSSLIPGMKERLELELKQRYNEKIGRGRSGRKSSTGPGLAVYASETRAFAVFEGAALFGDLISDEPNFWMTRDQYEQEQESNMARLLKKILLQ